MIVYTFFSPSEVGLPGINVMIKNILPKDDDLESKNAI
jgi:hypothetical protein